MDRKTVLRKIKACLRLAASPNPTEAATALRQARAMMAAHGISEAEALDVDEAEATTRARGAEPPESIVFLAVVCGMGFGAEVITLRGGGRTTIRFHGLHGAGEVAAYAFTVLRRQLDADRLKHLRLVRKRSNRERRGEIFALNWVRAVKHLFPAAEVPEADKSALQAALAVRYGELKDGNGGRDLTKRGKANKELDHNDAWAGLIAGTAAKLRSGIKGRPEEPQGTLALEFGQ